jgi:beta-galactosidase GanA
MVSTEKVQLDNQIASKKFDAPSVDKWPSVNLSDFISKFIFLLTQSPLKIGQPYRTTPSYTSETQVTSSLLL